MFNLDQIKSIIPHREPFIMIDRVTNATVGAGMLLSSTPDTVQADEDFAI
jgi:3-hydroxymyristoyl/3-hydroxydecanoyl-(acyl carrier protein) dehydratase